MMEHTYKKIEIVGSSRESLQKAIETAIERASRTVRNMRWFELFEVRGNILEGKIEHWQATVKVGFDVE